MKVNFKMEILEIDGTSYYTLPSEYYENEYDASIDGYHWDYDVQRWIQPIVDELQFFKLK